MQEESVKPRHRDNDLNIKREGYIIRIAIGVHDFKR